MKFENLIRLFAPAVLLAMSAVSANAGQISGSLPLFGFNVTQDAIDLAASTFVDAASIGLSGSPSGDYAVVTNAGWANPIQLTFATVLTGGGFAFSDNANGSFTAMSGLFTTHTSTNVDVFLLGTFTPGTNFGLCGGTACVPTTALVHVSVNQTTVDGHTALSEAITLASPADTLPTTPEPATMTLFGSALVGLGLMGRKRMARR